ncbi:MAG: phosphoribosylanthranilate isomerase [Methylobacterium sp.]|nr:phosphoribosylanthranilate isomerase [Methylobacterium sp.]MCA3603458.1 phosphoribosylanthranilate isomerase [Methylobacterium sp.]MCA3615143.1 phosphoribosylanthranilate isomerase [Methylobacterium sp.]MCA3626744.1 phosphoribosylanthranilate isomerase [Methylobacterium sp.]MCA4909995.1 phosphoribosylanthranilate isomerase [Methylobacterium sp.]
MSLLVKICGLKTVESIETALTAGADMIGFVFHPKSPRFITTRLAAALADAAAGRAKIAALVVDPGDDQLAAINSAVSPDLWQFHGHERYERLRDVRAVFGLPVMKAVGVAEAADLPGAAAYARVSDRILLDAKPPKDAAYPGGHGKVFDWSILSALSPDLPFMVSGGLTPENVGEAIRTIRGMGLNLLGVDVSSGVESAPGVKDLGKIRAFIAAAREADQT